MKLSILMYMLVILHSMISMQRTVGHSPSRLLFSVLNNVVNCCEIWITCVEHLKPVMEQIVKLEEALYNVQFEQHWLEAQTERQALGALS